MQDIKIEHGRFLLNRYDNLYNTTNQKAQFLMAFHAFVGGSVILKASDVLSLFSKGDKFHITTGILLTTLLLSALTSIVLTIMAVYPYIGKSKQSSLIFFGDISLMEKDQFVRQYSSQQINDLKLDFTNQIHVLAKGLNKKFKLMAWALACIYIEVFSLIAIFLFVLISNLK